MAISTITFGGSGSFTVEGTVQINGNYSSNGDVDVVGIGAVFYHGIDKYHGYGRNSVWIAQTIVDGTMFGTKPCFRRNKLTHKLCTNQYLCSGRQCFGIDWRCHCRRDLSMAKQYHLCHDRISVISLVRRHKTTIQAPQRKPHGTDEGQPSELAQELRMRW